MTDFALGPFLMSGERLIWILATLVLWVAAALVSRKGRPDLNPWAFRAALAGLVGARLGFVAQNADVYQADPLSIFAIWQGGFALWGGVAGFAAMTLPLMWRRREMTPWIAASTLPALTILFILGQLLRAHEQFLPQDRPFIDLAGTQMTLEGPAVVNLWATWCPPCRREMPMMVEEAQANPDLPIYFVNQGESPEKIRQYLSSAGLVMTPVLDPSLGLMAQTGILGLPATLFVDAEGRVTRAHIGEISRAALRQGISDLKKGTP
ncbi:TlpA disulfide reductase family protein [Falsigemmobacter faecalis]|uniref:TlpA family protein disulfide reductase n=1 Tax=Falsigemmobacter faecalis TaxID=2488730 RepID=A0A3P3DMF0_9RHOB|nr:TlpA disulfide reductase family protein [Falsigemmobacter faecalis]RRH73798.1 TlpA family protein disulfide reductase [Falsigemmobacter faecalis]